MPCASWPTRTPRRNRRDEDRDHEPPPVAARSSSPSPGTGAAAPIVRGLGALVGDGVEVIPDAIERGADLIQAGREALAIAGEVGEASAQQVGASAGYGQRVGGVV